MEEKEASDELKKRKRPLGRPTLNKNITPLTDQEFSECFSHPLDEIFGKQESLAKVH